MKKALFDITGMSCSSCSSHLEKEIGKLPGVIEASVNLLANSMAVTLDESMSVDRIIAEVSRIGFSAALKSEEAPKAAVAPAESPVDTELRSMKRRLYVSALFTLPLFYLSMGDMLGWPLPAFFKGADNAMVYALTLFLLALPVAVANYAYFQGGLKSLLRRSPNMNSLIAVGSGAAMLYGVYALYQIGWALGHGQPHAAHEFSMNLYFESAAMILTLITLGKLLELRAKGKTGRAIALLMNLTPKTAAVLRNGREEIVPAEEIVPGDKIIVRAGDSVPVDGVIMEGSAALDESAITGESMPAEKKENDPVTGGTVSQSGYFVMEAGAVGSDTVLSKIISLVEEASASKAPAAKLADKISGVFVPVVMGIALCAFAVWMLAGKGFEFSLTAAISVLVISCPCALGLATPTAIMAGMGKGASMGILVKSAEGLELLCKADTVVLDKTGTVTEGTPTVTDIYPCGASRKELLSLAASLESLSGHPLAAPIVALAEGEGLSLQEVTDYELIPGQGLIGQLGGQKIAGGNKKLMAARGVSTEAFAEEEALESNGKTLLYFASGQALLGVVALADSLKPDSREAVAQLTHMGMEVILLTGDNEKTARAIGQSLGLSRIMAEVLPSDKEAEIRKLQEQGKRVVMVGDGINDAPALARADVGIAIGAGTDVAMESAGIVLMKSALTDVAEAIRLSRAVLRNIRQNLFWAFLYNCIGIPVAAGVLYPAFGLTLNPMIGAAAMSLSSVSVVSNALRLNFFKGTKK